MADGFDIHLDERRASRLRQAAAAAGMDARAFAVQLLDRGLEEDWMEDFHRVAEYERTGESIGADQWMRGLQDSVRKHFKS